MAGRTCAARGAHGEDIDEILPRVHRVISNLKSWLQGTRRGVSGEHLHGAGAEGVLAQMARSRMRTKISQLEEAFTGHFDDHHRFLLTRMPARIDAIDADIAAIDAEIEAHLAPFVSAAASLDDIPGSGRSPPRSSWPRSARTWPDSHRGAPVLLGEVGTRHQLLGQQDQRKRIDRARQPLPRPRPG